MSGKGVSNYGILYLSCIDEQKDHLRCGKLLWLITNWHYMDE